MTLGSVAVAHPAVDPKFKALIPPLTEDELAQLEANLIEQGCRDPLVVWAEMGVVLDGHNRLEICKRRDISYQVVRSSFADRQAAEAWVINNQLGRRNLHPDQISVLRGKRYNGEKQALGGQIPGSRVDQNDPPIPTADRLATEYKVSPATIKRDGKFAESVDALEAAGIDPHEVVAVVPKSTVVEVAGKLATGEITATAVKDVIASKWTGDMEGYTPEKYVEAARSVLGAIDCDPASNPMAQQVVKAARYFTSETNGLDKEWTGRVFLNPPYNHPLIRHFIDRLLEQVETGKTTAAILLTNNNTDTSWFHLAASKADAICFTRGRINFYKPDGKISQPTNGQAFFYFGSDVEAFTRIFSESVGLVVEVAQ